MKEAKIKDLSQAPKLGFSKQISKGGKVIKASECDYESYLRKLLICPYCDNAVFLAAKESTKRIPHFRHFPGTGIHCPAKTNPQLLNSRITLTGELDDLARGQAKALFKARFHSIVTNCLIVPDNMKDMDYCIKLSRELYVKRFPDFWQFKSVSKDIPALAKNLTATLECCEIIWEDLWTTPDSKHIVFDGSKPDPTADALKKRVKEQDLRIELAIYKEVIRYLTTIEATKILEWLTSVCWQGVMQAHKEAGHFPSLEELRKWRKTFPPCKYFYIMVLLNLAQFPWIDIMEANRQNTMCKEQRSLLIYQAGDDLMVEIASKLQPINFGSSKGFGR
jgi:hypothetical protein